MGALLLDPTCCMCTLPQSNANLNNDYQTSRGLEDGRTNSSTIKIAKPIRKRSPIRKSKVTRVSTEECDEEYNARQWKPEEVAFECENDIYCAPTFPLQVPIDVQVIGVQQEEREQFISRRGDDYEFDFSFIVETLIRE